MKNQVTSIEQSKRLIELGVPAEKASMVWEMDEDCARLKISKCLSRLIRARTTTPALKPRHTTTRMIRTT